MEQSLSDKEAMGVNCRDLNDYGKLQIIRKKGYLRSKNEEETHYQNNVRLFGS